MQNQQTKRGDNNVRALGQKRTCAVQKAMSVLLKADVVRLRSDDLVGSREQRRRHGQAVKSLRCLQVYDEFVFAWSLHRQIGRFFAFHMRSM